MYFISDNHLAMTYNSTSLCDTIQQRLNKNSKKERKINHSHTKASKEGPIRFKEIKPGAQAHSRVVPLRPNRN